MTTDNTPQDVTRTKKGRRRNAEDVESKKPQKVPKDNENTQNKKPQKEGVTTVKLKTMFKGGRPLYFDLDTDTMKSTLVTLLKQVIDVNKKVFKKNLEKEWLDQMSDPLILNKCIRMYNLSVRLHVISRLQSDGPVKPDTFGAWGDPKCSFDVASRIVEIASDCAVPRPTDLNRHYECFSSETYGETNFIQLATCCNDKKIAKIGADDVFVDLGSGVGKLVCFMAAYSGCKKSVGIELSEFPASNATKLGGYFGSLMKFFGKTCAPYELHQGNMLDAKFRKLITEEATVIFINNIQFDAKLHEQIKSELLQAVQKGTRIITTKALGSLETKPITRRSVRDFDSVSETIKIKSVANNVSWTGTTIQFYCTTVDFTRLQAFYDQYGYE